MNIPSILLSIVILLGVVESACSTRFLCPIFNPFNPEFIKAYARMQNEQKIQKLLDSEPVHDSLHDGTIVPPYQEPKITADEIDMQKALRLLGLDSTPISKNVFDVKIFQTIEGTQVQLHPDYVKALLNSWNSSELKCLTDSEKYSAFVGIMKDNNIAVSIDRLDKHESGTPKTTFHLDFDNIKGDSESTKVLPKQPTFLLKEHGETKTKITEKKSAKEVDEAPTINIDSNGIGNFDLPNEDPISVSQLDELNSSGTSSVKASSVKDESSSTMPATKKSVELDAATTKSSESPTLTIVFCIIMGIIAISLGAATYMSMRKSQEENVDL